MDFFVSTEAPKARCRVGAFKTVPFADVLKFVEEFFETIRCFIFTLVTRTLQSIALLQMHSIDMSVQKSSGVEF